jgi:hypothetical protein
MYPNAVIPPVDGKVCKRFRLWRGKAAEDGLPAMFSREMDGETLLVRLRGGLCNRKGAYRPVRLALKYGPDIARDDLLRHLTADCAKRLTTALPYGHPSSVDCTPGRSGLASPRLPWRLRADHAAPKVIWTYRR